MLCRHCGAQCHRKPCMPAWRKQVVVGVTTSDTQAVPAQHSAAYATVVCRLVWHMARCAGKRLSTKQFAWCSDSLDDPSWPLTLLTAAKLNGMNSTTALRTASDTKSTSSRNLRATLSKLTSGQGWNQSMTVLLMVARKRCNQHHNNVSSGLQIFCLQGTL